ncbi:aminodeoxychorismate synthase component I [Thermodesulfobacteriota bacterium]
MNTSKPFSDASLHSLLTGLAGKESFVFLESTRVTSENHLSFLFQDPVERLVCNYSDDPVDFLRRAQKYIDKGFYLAGYIAYEFGYMLEPSLAKSFTPRSAPDNSLDPLPLTDLGVFSKPQIYDHLNESCKENESWPKGLERESGATFSIDNLSLSQEREEYLEAIHRIKSYIGSGDTYQVNYTLKLLFDFAGSIPEFYSSLRRNQSVSYGGLIKNGRSTILTFSPELFFRKSGNKIDVRPMKGTMLRGRTNAEDRDLADFLQHDIKNRSENVMIVDLLRNDLGRLSRMGGVNVQSLFDVETYETLHQMTSSIRGKVNGSLSLEKMFRALFPCGSVTGAPKIRTMEIIRELEVEDRGVYTGAIGFISPEGDAVFNVPIRTVVLQGDKGEMGIGSGIVWDSDPVGEWDESILKGRFLTRSVPGFKLIETMLWHSESGYWLLDLHLNRLAESADYFFYQLDLDKIKADLNELAEGFLNNVPVENQRVRLTLSKHGEIELTSTVLPEGLFPGNNPLAVLELDVFGDLSNAVFSGRNSDSNSPYLFHKTTLRKLYDDERSRAVNKGFYEVLFVNEKGEVTEGSYTNIFMQKGGKLITPPVSCGLLPGVFRNFLLKESPEIIEEASFTRKDIEQAEAVYVGNSVRGLVRVSLG